MSLFPGFLRKVADRLARARGNQVSSHYRLYPENPESLKGWTEAGVAERQHQAFKPLIQDAKNGKARRDFRVAAESITETAETDPLILEVGCGSGYYSEILPLLLGSSIRYVGVDYSTAMTALAREKFPESGFVAGDATALPIATESCDIAFSGTSLMHIPGYPQAIAEMVRISRRWCLFHTVPVLNRRPTTVLGKLAYGAPVPEIIFNRAELEALFARHGLIIHSVRESFPYDLKTLLGESTITLTYLCRKGRAA